MNLFLADTRAYQRDRHYVNVPGATPEEAAKALCARIGWTFIEGPANMFGLDESDWQPPRAATGTIRELLDEAIRQIRSGESDEAFGLWYIEEAELDTYDWNNPKDWG